MNSRTVDMDAEQERQYFWYLQEGYDRGEAFRMAREWAEERDPEEREEALKIENQISDMEARENKRVVE